MTMLERMARAQYDAWIADVQELEEPWDVLPQSHRERLTDSLRAALQALREPDEGMRSVAWKSEERWENNNDNRYRVDVIFTAMIDHMLGEGDE